MNYSLPPRAVQYNQVDLFTPTNLIKNKKNSKAHIMELHPFPCRVVTCGHTRFQTPIQFASSYCDTCSNQRAQCAALSHQMHFLPWHMQQPEGPMCSTQSPNALLCRPCCIHLSNWRLCRNHPTAPTAARSFWQLISTLTPGKTPVPRGWVVPRVGLDGWKISSPSGIDPGPSSP
jgi:hypothetical protein